MPVKKVEIPELGTVSLHKRRGVRSIRLTIAHSGEIKVSLPYWVPYATGAAFAASKLEWIKSRQIIADPLKHGGRVGKAHRLVFISEENRVTATSRITSTGEIRVFYPADLSSTDPLVQKAAERACVRALTRQAKALLPKRLRDLAELHGFSYNSVTVKKLSSRWGSCTEQKDIALNCYLMQLPWYLIDYVLLHELTHTKIMAHGKVFWDELEKYVPNLKAIRKEMKTHRPVLLAE